MKAIGTRRAHIALALIGAIAWGATMAAIVIIAGMFTNNPTLVTAASLAFVSLATGGFPALIAVIGVSGNDDHEEA